VEVAKERQKIPPSDGAGLVVIKRTQARGGCRIGEATLKRREVLHIRVEISVRIIGRIIGVQMQHRRYLM
jgi:hypothetical protein